MEDLDSDGELEDEDAKAARIIAERRKARQAIVDKYKSGAAPAAGGTAKAAPSPARTATSAPAAATAGSGGSSADADGADDDDDAAAKKDTYDLFGDADPEVKADDLLEGQDRYIDEVDAGLEEEAKDEEGYFSVKAGEHFNKGRYSVMSAVGRGVFSTVVCAKDTVRVQRKAVLFLPFAAFPLFRLRVFSVCLSFADDTLLRSQSNDMDVAIKVIRSNDVMYRAGQKEIALLRKIAEVRCFRLRFGHYQLLLLPPANLMSRICVLDHTQADPDDKKHIVKMLDTFMHKGHLCIVFERYDKNLREVRRRCLPPVPS